jgi:hypothetical protein
LACLRLDDPIMIKAATALTISLANGVVQLA